MNLADLYSTLETVRRNAKGLLSNPTDTLNQWGSQIKEDLGQYDQGNARAMGLLSAGNPDAAAQATLQNNMGIGTGAGLLGLHIAYHGTPHVVDKFSMDKVGTGEGAQAYGHGLYFAENPQTAKAYQNTLGGTSIGNTNSLLAPQGSAEKTAAGWVDYFTKVGTPDPVSASLKKAESSGERQGVLDVLRQWSEAGAQPKPGGNLYKVDINADPAHYLDWDKPLSQQSPKVRKTIMDAVPNANPDSTGQQLYDVLRQLRYDYDLKMWGRGNPEAASTFLRDAGIPGIKYKDAGSRGTDSGTHNYVVFDDSLINNLGPQP